MFVRLFVGERFITGKPGDLTGQPIHVSLPLLRNSWSRPTEAQLGSSLARPAGTRR
jgi:hypothetical protein